MSTGASVGKGSTPSGNGTFQPRTSSHIFVMQEDLGTCLAEKVYPALFGRLDSAFPEFGFVKHGDSWEATRWPAGFPYTVEQKRPDRLMVYPDRPWWIKVHGHTGLRFLDYVNKGKRPRGEEFF